MDVINIPNEEKELHVSIRLLDYMVFDNCEAWLNIIHSGRVTKNLLTCLELLPGSKWLELIRTLGIEQFKLPDEVLERIIGEITTYGYEKDDLKQALEEAFHDIQCETLRKALKEHVKADWQE